MANLKENITTQSANPENDSQPSFTASVKSTNTYHRIPSQSRKILSIWLFSIAGLIAVMVMVGGATRLTDSGLSITQWDLIMGAFPPMGESGWQEEFQKYQQIPEYERVNKGMSLNEFKSIYWWEWSHRNLGRFIGMAFLIPMLIFFMKGTIKETAIKWRLAGIFILIFAQGALGWYMVSSGLEERVDVSQYRLAAHLGLAVTLFAAVLWLAFKLSFAIPYKGQGRNKIFSAIAIYTGLIFIQMILGAFVAGLRAGKTFNTWPLMDGRFIPNGYFGSHGWAGIFETMAAVQFNHRLGAYILFTIAILLWIYLRRFGDQAARYGGLLVAAVTGQACLGIWTVVTAVPIHLGLAHQFGALLILGLCIYILVRTDKPNST
ncbi:MAG: COX15/CtaA family protein [bacterium]